MNIEPQLANLRSAILVVLVCVGFWIGPVMATTGLEQKIATVLPDAQEDAWLKIGWHTNLMQARVLAQNANRPLFLWIMNGHPLGCT